MVVVQSEERNMYDQHWLCSVLKEKYPFSNKRPVWGNALQDELKGFIHE